jgi:hypothetical protein
MTTTGLNGRLTRLERAIAPPALHQCRACGLRHVRPLTIALVRGVLRLSGGSGFLAPITEPLCLCDGCCGDAGDRWLARLSHGLPADGDA